MHWWRWTNVCFVVHRNFTTSGLAVYSHPISTQYICYSGNIHVVPQSGNFFAVKIQVQDTHDTHESFLMPLNRFYVSKHVLWQDYDRGHSGQKCDSCYTTMYLCREQCNYQNHSLISCTKLRNARKCLQSILTVEYNGSLQTCC